MLIYLYLLFVMYSSRFFGLDKNKKILTVVSGVIGVLSICHFLYAAYLSKISDFYKDSFFGFDWSLFKKLYIPPIIFLSFAGALQVLINVYYILLLWGVIKLTKVQLNITIILLILQIGMIFVVGVAGSMAWTYYSGIWKQYLEWPTYYLQLIDARWRNFYYTVINAYRICSAESILSFLVAIPLITFQILLFFDKNVEYKYLQVGKVGDQIASIQEINQIHK